MSKNNKDLYNLSFAEQLAINMRWAIAKYKISKMVDEAYKPGSTAEEHKALIKAVFHEAGNALNYEMGIRFKDINKKENDHESLGQSENES